MGYWARQFKRLRPTAVLVFETYQYISLLSFCAQTGIRIPQDLSVVCHCYDRSFDWFVPRPAMMPYPGHKTLAHFRQWLKADLRPIGHKHIGGIFQEGATLAASPADTPS